MGQGELADQLTHEDMGAAAIGLPVLMVASPPSAATRLASGCAASLTSWSMCGLF